MVKSNLTALYANKENPNVLGREKEISMIILTLLRKEKCNVLLVGEAGVGKTALVHQLAYLIANNLVPSELDERKVVEINTNALISGDGYRGCTEKKFEEIIDEAKVQNQILFIDEFHTVEHLGEMSNGQTPGFGNMLKPHLTQNSFCVIGATTNDEYSKIKDKALLRRMFKINVSEPSKEVVMKIIQSVYLKYAGISISEEIRNKTYTLSSTLDGLNPDKSKDLIDFYVAYCKLNKLEVDSINNLDSFFSTVYNISAKSLY